MTVINQSKVIFQVESLIEVLNNTWKVNAIMSGHSCYHQLSYVVGRKYLKMTNELVGSSGKSVYMFVDKETGACYMPASYKGPAKGIRYQLETLLDAPETCDSYGSFLYMR